MISTTVATVTVNAAFLQEIKEVHEELWQLLNDLQQQCAGGVPAGKSAHLFVRDLALLRDQIALHFALEEAYGYFDDPAHVAPRLCENAEALRQQHQVLYVEISEIADDVEFLPNKGRVSRRIVTRFQDFHRRLMLHEQAEEELILSMYADDIGVGD